MKLPAGVFDATQAQTLREADSDHWWFASKATLVRSAISRSGGIPQGWLVDLGAGSGGVSSRLASVERPVLAVEGATELAGDCRRRGLLSTAGAVTAVPLADGAAAVVTLLDVIEHLGEPDKALAEARRLLPPGGLLVVTVPAHAWLWSEADELLGHVRRYTRRILRDQLAQSGFQVLRCGHVFSWLVPPVWFRRHRAQGGQDALGLDTGGPRLTAIARRLTAAEDRVVGRIDLPLGTSLLATARAVA